MINKKCYVCSKDFSSSKSYAKYCSHECSKKYHAEKTGRISDKTIPPGTVGAVSEVAVCVDLLEKGYHVFRSISQSSPCDLIALKDNKMERIEVKTGYKSFDGRLTYPSAKKNVYDKLAIYVRTSKEVVYL